MAKRLLLLLAAVGGAAAVARRLAPRDDADVWREATRAPDLR